MTRFAVSPPWRFVVTKKNGAILTFLDRLASNRSVTYLLDAPGNAKLRAPSENPEVNILTAGRPFVANNDRLLYGFRRDSALSTSGHDLPYTVRFGGIIEQVSDVGDTERALTEITAYDPWQYLYTRPVVVNAAGDLPGVDGYTFFDTPAGLIAAALLADSIAASGTTHIDAGVTYQGTGFWGGSITVDPDSAVSITFPRGMSVGEAWSKLIGTGAIDIVLTPIYDPTNRPGYLADLSISLQAGSVQDDAIFAWDKPSKSLIAIDRLTDGAQMANKVMLFVGEGGVATALQTDAASVAQYGEYWATQAFPGASDSAAIIAGTALAYRQLQLRKQGKTTVNFTPTPERSPDPFNEFYLGDRVPVYASDRFRQAIPAGIDVQYQRVYGFTVNLSDERLESLQMQTSDEGLTSEPPSLDQTTIRTSLVGAQNTPVLRVVRGR